MKPNESRVNEDAGRFRTTHWSVVLLSAQSQMPGSRSALADLCRLYWYPLYAFVRRRGYTAEDAQDLTQGFFLSLLERRSLRQVHPDRGKFRSFLLASIKNYLSDAFQREKSIKRGGRIEFVPLDLPGAEERYSEILREEVARTVTNSEEVDEEIHSLCEALIATEGQLGP